MRTQIVVSKEKMRRFGKYDVKLVATGKERERAIKYQALLNREGMEDGSGPGKFKWHLSCLSAKSRDCKICDSVWLNWIAAPGTVHFGMVCIGTTVSLIPIQCNNTCK
jgi:hypothetical protein